MLNKIKMFIKKITRDDIIKACKVVIICMLFMVLAEGLFQIPAIANLFGKNLVEGKTGVILYVVLWIVMFAQVAIIPIPALPILVACNKMVGVVGKDGSIGGLFSLQTLLFMGVVVSATVCGAVVAYWLGRILGKPAIKWVAGSEEDYEKWSKKLNGKVGKWTYAATVLLPIFPDDLLSIVVGSIKLDFGFYFIVNLICKAIGLFTMLFFMRIPGISKFFGETGSNSPLALIVYTIILLVAIALFTILSIQKKKENKKDIT